MELIWRTRSSWEEISLFKRVRKCKKIDLEDPELMEGDFLIVVNKEM